MEDKVTLSRNASENRYELHVGDALAGRIDYTKDGRIVELLHTEVDPAFTGQGYGQRLIEFALAEIRDKDLRVNPTCPYVARYIDQHSDFEDLKETGHDGLIVPDLPLPTARAHTERPYR